MTGIPTRRRTRGPCSRSAPAFALAAVAASAACAAPTELDPIVYEQYEPVDGLLRIGPEPGRAIEMVERGHTLLLPRGERPRGLVVFLDSRRFDAWSAPMPGGFDHAALAQGLAVLHLTTGNPLDFLFGDSSVAHLADRLEALVERYDLAHDPVFLAGLSLGGTRAARLAIHLLRNPSDGIQLTALALVDAPLDMERLWRSEGRSIHNDFHPAAADEGRWVRYLLERHFGGPPAEYPGRYRAYSPFSIAAPQGGNAAVLRTLPVRAYHEPDVDWWIANRRKSYYDMNSLDLAALVNQLLLLGNTRTELVTTHAQRDGYETGTSPHTWSIVDDAELVQWFLSHRSTER
jgi:hypothetical protein